MNERYTFVSLLSKKPGICTWLAFDEVTQQTCIAKSASLCDKLQLHQLKTEIQVLSKLKGQSFCSLLDVFEKNGQLILIQTRLEGISLEEWLKQKPDRRKRKQIFLQIVRLVQKVHEAGFLYMDLKADNILIHQNKAWLIDFNAALPMGSTQVLLANAGSLPPECRENKPLSPKADQIGLGNLYLKMLGPGWISWKCLQKKPGMRFASLEHLQSSLRPKASFSMVMAGGACALLLFSSLASPLSTSSLSFGQPEMYLKTPGQLDAYLKQENSDLYALALSQALDPALYENEESFLRMALWAVEKKDPLMASHLYQSMSDAQKDKLYYLALPLRQTCGDVLKTKELESLFGRLLESEASPECLQALFSMLYVQGIVIHEPAKIEAMLRKPGKWPADAALRVMEYLLYLKSIGHHIPLSEPLKQALQKTSQGASLLNLYERSSN